MERFAFLLHPLDIEDVARKYKIAKKVNPKVVASILKRKRPAVLSHIEGIRSTTGAEAEGVFIVVPFLPWQFLELEEEYVLKKMFKAFQIAEEEGAKIVGLGAFTAIAGDNGRRLAESSNIAVTTGNTYTVSTAIESTYRAADMMGVELSNAKLAIVGGSGSIGAACVEVMASKFKNTVLIGRDKQRLEAAALRGSKNGSNVSVSTSIEDALQDADVVIAVSGASTALIEPEQLKTGAIICDVARPRDVSRRVKEQRRDVLIIDGGIVEVPGPVKFNFDFGLPPKMALACMAETMILALEKRYENYTIGKEISVDKIVEINQLAHKHGFAVAGLRSFERAVSDKYIADVKDAVRTRSQAADLV